MDDARAEFEKAIDLFGQGRKEEAARALHGLTQRFPEFYDAYESLGMVYYKMGNLEEAIAWTSKLAALRPEYPMAHTNLSVFYMKQGLKEKAEEEKAIATVLNFQKPGLKK